MNEVIQNIKTRRSVRSFADKRISDEDLREIAEAGMFAPSGMNRQTWQFTVVHNQEKIKALAAAIAEVLGRSGYNFYTPDALIIPSNVADSAWGRDDNACALQNIFLVAHSLGIGSVWINQLRDICDNPKIRPLLRDLGIPDNHIVYGLAALGYAASAPKEIAHKEAIVFVK